MAKEVSIIVPVYNVEKYLRTCLDSILRQTFQDFELILIDDGSTDQSGQICDEYAAQHDCMIVLHKKNAGPNAARIDGIKLAKGTFITFIDSDDWIEPNHIELLVNSLKEKNADIVQCDYFINQDDKQTYVKNEPTSYGTKELIIQFLHGTIHSGLPLKMVRKELFQEENFEFPKADFNEDLHMTISLVMFSKSFIYLPIATYHYYMNDSSITHIKTEECKLRKYKDFVTNMEDIYNCFKLYNDKDINHAILRRVNNSKRELVKANVIKKDRLKELLSFFPKSFTVHDIHSIGDFCFYIASRFKIVFPYHIKQIISHQNNAKC